MNDFRVFTTNCVHLFTNREKLLTELSCFLRYTPDRFNFENISDNLDVALFFQILNGILATDCINDDFLWVVFQVIEIAIQNESTRQYLIDQVRIITGVANFAAKVCPSLTSEKQSRVWTLVENITIDIQIFWEESHIASLLDYLVPSIEQTDLPKDIKMLQASVLTNICFQNKCLIASLLRRTKSKALLENLKEIRVLCCKMAIAMSRFDCSLYESELLINLKTIFEVEYFSGLMRCNDQRVLRHISELLTVGLMSKDEHSKNIIREFDFKEAVEAVLTLIDNSEISQRNPASINLFLGIANAILTVSNKSLETTLPRLLKISIESTNISAEVIRTVRLIACNEDVAVPQDLIVLITRLMTNIEVHHNNSLVTCEIYRLLTALYGARPVIINQLPKDIINKSIDVETRPFTLSDFDLSTQIYRLQWLLVYTSEDEILREKLLKVMNDKIVHHIFASALRNSNEEICALTMTLIRDNHFPLEAVAKIMSHQFTSTLPTPTASNYDHPCKSAVGAPYFSEDLEKRVSICVDKLMLERENVNGSAISFKSAGVRNLEKSLFGYQNIFACKKVESLKSLLKESEDMITLQSNEIGGLNIMIRNYKMVIIDLEDSLIKVKEDKDKMEKGFVTLNSKHDEANTKLNDLKKRHGALQKEKTELSHAKKQLDQHIYDLKAKHTKHLESELAKINAQHDRKMEEQKAEHVKELNIYSAKITDSRAAYNRELEEVTSRHLLELEKNAKKIEHMEKERVEKVKKINEMTKEIEKTKTDLAETTEKLVEHEKNADAIANLLRVRNR